MAAGHCCAPWASGAAGAQMAPPCPPPAPPQEPGAWPGGAAWPLAVLQGQPQAPHWQRPSAGAHRSLWLQNLQNLQGRSVCCRTTAQNIDRYWTMLWLLWKTSQNLRAG